MQTVPFNNNEKRVALVSMPFTSVFRPALGISLLKSALQQRGIDTEVLYLHLLFAELLGLERYGLISQDAANCAVDYIKPKTEQSATEASANRNAEFNDTLPTNLMVGDWLFSRYFYDQTPEQIQTYEQECLRDKSFALYEREIQSALSIAPTIPEYLQQCMESVDWGKFFLVGFSTTFEQNMASLCLARMIKERYPDIIIAFGGANCEDVMGEELHRQYSFIDYVISGEADRSFPQLVETVLQGQTAQNINGVTWRRDGKTVRNPPAPVIRDMDNLPYPDFDDYFRHSETSPLLKEEPPLIALETSRGCWWGEKSHCTFCGLNGNGMVYRAKSATRAYDEIMHFAERYSTDIFMLVDNIMDFRYLKSLLPMLANSDRRLNFFYETKANLKKEQLALMKSAGINFIQPGIERFEQPDFKTDGQGLQRSTECHIAEMVSAIRHHSRLESDLRFSRRTAAGIRKNAGHTETPDSFRTCRYCPDSSASFQSVF